ncbi:hypothetical protein LTR22_013204 [Elasticomyces elasticus]|nr:hypothetical protein LTR22_013204 [Elasticomyces elasticus]KAK4911063.1 hypothetical protein LTR49_020326 [Elasticomyces elasticus]
MDRSPLVRLPPEIREQIFKYALGNNRIHFDYGDRGTDVYPQIFLCRAANVPPRRRNESMLLANHFNRDLGHTSCGRPKPGQAEVDGHHVPLGLLSSCRQINKEAALLPFSDNTFLFSDRDPFRGLARFLASLKPHQAGAVHSLVIVCMYPKRPWHRPDWLLPAEIDFIVRTLPNLKDLHHVVELARQTSDQNYLGELLSMRQGLAEGILMFRHIPLRSLEVRFCCIRRKGLGDQDKVAEMEAFGRALEEDIIKQMTVERGPT